MNDMIPVIVALIVLCVVLAIVAFQQYLLMRMWRKRAEETLKSLLTREAIPAAETDISKTITYLDLKFPFPARTVKGDRP